MIESSEPGLRARVEFLRIRPVAGERRIVEVPVPHLARAASTAREHGGLSHEEWVILSIVEVANPGQEEPHG